MQLLATRSPRGRTKTPPPPQQQQQLEALLDLSAIAAGKNKPALHYLAAVDLLHPLVKADGALQVGIWERGCRGRFSLGAPLQRPLALGDLGLQLLDLGNQDIQVSLGE